MGATAPGRTLWVDMESSLRTTLKDDTDVFDANKAMACVRCVIELGLEPKACARRAVTRGEQVAAAAAALASEAAVTVEARRQPREGTPSAQLQRLCRCGHCATRLPGGVIRIRGIAPI